jgi:hypothetical protein
MQGTQCLHCCAPGPYCPPCSAPNRVHIGGAQDPDVFCEVFDKLLGPGGAPAGEADGAACALDGSNC